MTKVDLAKIKKLRKQMKLTQGEMADKLGLTSGKLYHDREVGRVYFSADEVAQLAIVLGVAIETLYAENFFAQAITQNVIDELATQKKGA
jgi:transcriptional regulator with XRE-family HTH domain